MKVASVLFAVVLVVLTGTAIVQSYAHHEEYARKRFDFVTLMYEQCRESWPQYTCTAQIEKWVAAFEWEEDSEKWGFYD